MNIITTKNELLEAYTFSMSHCLTTLYRHQGIVLRVETRPRYPHRRLAIAALPSLGGGLSVAYLEERKAPRITSLELVSPQDTEYYLSQGTVVPGHPTLGEIPSRVQEVIKQALEAFSEINDAESRGHEELLTKIRELKSNQYT